MNFHVPLPFTPSSFEPPPFHPLPFRISTSLEPVSLHGLEAFLSSVNTIGTSVGGSTPPDIVSRISNPMPTVCKGTIPLVGPLYLE